MRHLMAEWWELWWMREGCTPVRYGSPDKHQNPRIPAFGFATSKAAHAARGRHRNRYFKVVHVRRYRNW